MDSFYFTLSTTLIVRSNRSCHKDPIMCVCVSPTQMDIHAVDARLANGSLMILAIFYVEKEFQIKRPMAVFCPYILVYSFLLLFICFISIVDINLCVRVVLCLFLNNSKDSRSAKLIDSTCTESATQVTYHIRIVHF